MRYAVAASFGMLLLIASALFGADGDKKLPDQAKAILDNASEFELYALDPGQKQNKSDKEAALHGWRVLGKTQVKEVETRQKLVAAVEHDLANATVVANCFDPRHAIRATHEDQTVVLLICYKCRQMHVHIDGKYVADLVIATGSRPLLDKVLLDAEVPLTKPTEIMALKQFIGTWDTQTTVKIPRISFAEAPGGGLRTKGSIHCEWVLGERFIQGKAIDSLKQEFLMHWTYDLDKKVYRMWCFRSGGGVEDASGQWMPDSKTLVLKNDLDNGISNTATFRPQDPETLTFRVIDADTIEFKSEAKDRDGKPYLVMDSTWTRRK